MVELRDAALAPTRLWQSEAGPLFAQVLARLKRQAPLVTFPKIFSYVDDPNKQLPIPITPSNDETLLRLVFFTSISTSLHEQQFHTKQLHLVLDSWDRDAKLIALAPAQTSSHLRPAANR